MTKNTIYIGDKVANFESNNIEGKQITFENESYYKISNSDEMRPFFMSIISDSNHWMFISSNGGLTAGRKNAESSLFPYYTDDKITESADITGSKSIFHVHKNGKTYLWEPFSNRQIGIYKTQRNVYKNSWGNKVIFEEVNKDLGVTFRYQWNSSDQYGFIKKSTLTNITNEKIELTVLDGLQNLIPSAVTSDIQNSRSNLVDAYKKCELESEFGIGIYSLSAVIVDKAEPSEALKSTVVWSTGIENASYLISSLQVDNFRKGKKIIQEVDIKAEKGAYFIHADITLNAATEKTWMTIANVNQTMVHISEISELIKDSKITASRLQNDIELGTKRLKELAAASDGLQISADKLRNTRHFSNTLFNIMRGGIVDNNYNIEKEDFIAYINNANTEVFKKNKDVLEQLPHQFSLNALKEFALKDHDKNFIRLAFEYLPLKFSRRHGDPSRPWNKFSINTTAEDGSKILDYEGNWRDIFQNWEALAHSYPEFIESMIHKFLNATTFDGYNPYRVTKGGFDWETIEPNDPWSYIGYWGDHQIIYLLKFLEFIEKYYPNKLATLFDQELFVYANVPYKIKSYQETLANPKDTIVFDEESDLKISERRSNLGADGALLTFNTSIYKVNLIEKLLATVLAKVSNFIPEAGIWMNTQRPEWNDANNALVGNGVSMVTLCYLRRFLHFFEEVVENSILENYLVSEELAEFFSRSHYTLSENLHLLSSTISDADRKTVLDGLGSAGSDYRLKIYKNGFSNNKKEITREDLLSFLTTAKKHLEHTIDSNKREDNLYHSYNLMTVKNENEISVSYLSEMLEGQVAVLSSGYISSIEASRVLDALKDSALFRKDQYSYILYPNKELPRFSKKNNIPANRIQKSKLLQKLIEDKNIQLVEKDLLGNHHFNGNFNNAESLKEAISQLPQKYASLAAKETTLLLTIFEDIFDHKSFTGRSGTFFGYEGLGSIYWHMVSKLVLSIQENCIKAVENKEDPKIIGKLFDHYYEANEGIGVHKSPELYGAFPTDAYSHTPEGKGAQQPGMTGQVKEDIMSRMGELGISVTNGNIQFSSKLLRRDEFLREAKTFHYINTSKKEIALELAINSLCFTYCQVPIIYQLSDKIGIQVIFENGKTLNNNELKIDNETSQKIFERTGEVSKIIVSINK